MDSAAARNKAEHHDQTQEARPRPVIVAFLQNMWVKDVARHQKLLAQFGEIYRRKMMNYALFAGCMTGKRLKAAFGDELCKRIIWEEASRVVTSTPSESPPADPVHIAAVLEQYKPTLVICFGKTASNAVPPLFKGTSFIAPHPTARRIDTVTKLEQTAKWLQAAIACEERRQ